MKTSIINFFKNIQTKFAKYLLMSVEPEVLVQALSQQMSNNSNLIQTHLKNEIESALSNSLFTDLIEDKIEDKITETFEYGGHDARRFDRTISSCIEDYVSGMDLDDVLADAINGYIKEIYNFDDNDTIQDAIEQAFKEGMDEKLNEIKAMLSNIITQNDNAEIIAELLKSEPFKNLLKKSLAAGMVVKMNIEEV